MFESERVRKGDRERERERKQVELEIISDGAGGVDAAEWVGAGDARDAGAAVLRRGAGGLAVVRAQVDAPVQVPAGGGGVGAGDAHLRRRDPRAGRLAHPQGTPPSVHVPTHVPHSFLRCSFSSRGPGSHFFSMLKGQLY